MFSSISIIHFCSAAFEQYTQYTDVDLIFGTQIKYLRFYSFFFEYYIFERALAIICFLSWIYLICRPSDVNSLARTLEKKRKEGNASEMNDLKK